MVTLAASSSRRNLDFHSLKKSFKKSSLILINSHEQQQQHHRELWLLDGNGDLFDPFHFTFYFQKRENYFSLHTTMMGIMGLEFLQMEIAPIKFL